MLAKGGALLPEVRALLQTWHPGESAGDLGRRVLNDDVLGRATAARAQNIVQVFSLRFLRPDDIAARHLKRLAAPSAPRQMFTDLVMYYTARQDAMLRDFISESYWPRVRAGAAELRTEDAWHFIAEAHSAGRIAVPWSRGVREKMARILLAALTGFGLVRQDAPGRRSVLRYTPADGTIIYIAYLLHDRGVTDASLASQPGWALFGLGPGDVLDRLEGLVAAGWLIVQRAGDVVRISWTYGSVEEVLDVLVGR